MKPEKPNNLTSSGTDSPNYGLESVANAIKYLGDILWAIHEAKNKEEVENAYEKGKHYYDTVMD